MTLGISESSLFYKRYSWSATYWNVCNAYVWHLWWWKWPVVGYFYENGEFVYLKKREWATFQFAKVKNNSNDRLLKMHQKGTFLILENYHMIRHMRSHAYIAQNVDLTINALILPELSLYRYKLLKKEFKRTRKGYWRKQTLLSHIDSKTWKFPYNFQIFTKEF